MRTNGTLQYRIYSGDGFNDDGEPILSVEEWSVPIPCMVEVITNNSYGRYEDGKFNQASYLVLVEAVEFPTDVNRIKLCRCGTLLGEFAIQGLPIPTTMDRIKIIV